VKVSHDLLELAIAIVFAVLGVFVPRLIPA
jgi:hypothetical protein